jgi:hypothetical protein
MGFRGYGSHENVPALGAVGTPGAARNFAHGVLVKHVGEFLSRCRASRASR